MKNFFILFVLILIGRSLSAQEKYIEGMVTTFDSIVIINADIYVKGSGQTIKTDTLGRFKVEVASEDKLKVKAKGFITQTVKIEKNTRFAAVNLKLRPTEKAKEYAIGYGYVKDSERLNAIVKMTNDDVDFSLYQNMYDLIEGRFPGVRVYEDGNQEKNIVIRGEKSVNLSNSALIVINGIPRNISVLDSLSPGDVKSIDIIKDGGSAVYGSKGANGVIIIETKDGKK